MKKVVKIGLILTAMHQLVACSSTSAVSSNPFSSGAIYHQTGAVASGNSLAHGDLLMDD